MPQPAPAIINDDDGPQVVASNDTAIRVAIIDDHPLLCAGVSDSFSSDPRFEVVGIGATADTACDIAERRRPHLMVVDINIPGDGIDAVRRITSRHPNIKIVMLTAYEDAGSVLASLRAGANGYVLKGVSASELLGVAYSIMQGGSYVPPTLATELIGISRQLIAPPCNDECDTPLGLSAREAQILTRLSQGLSNSEIARSIGVAEKTVKNHVTSILRKLQVRNRVEAALLVTARSTARKQS